MVNSNKNREALDLLSNTLPSNGMPHMALNMSPSIIFMVDWDGKFLLANEAFAKFCSSTPQALIGQNIAALSLSINQVIFKLQNLRDVMSQRETRVVTEPSIEVSTGKTTYYESVQVPLVSSYGDKQILVIANDVTELQCTKLKLEASEQRFNSLLDVNYVAVWDWNITTDMVTHNRRWCDIVGLSNNYLHHRGLNIFTDLLHEEDKPMVIARIQSCLRGEGPYFSEHRMRLQSGKLVWVQDRGNVVDRDVNGLPLRMMGSFLDITQRKDRELIAKRSEQLMHEAINHIAIGFSIYDEQDCLYFFNEAYKRIHEGNSNTIVIGEKFENVVRKEAEISYHSATLVAQRIEQHQNAKGGVLEQHLTDGRYFLLIESRTPSGFTVCNHFDITQLKSSQKLMQNYTEQLNAISELILDGFVTFDSTQHVSYVSPAFYRMTGLSHAQLSGSSESIFSQFLAQICTPKSKFPGVQNLRESKSISIEPNDRGPINFDDIPHQCLIELQGAYPRIIAVRLRHLKWHGASEILYLRDITREINTEHARTNFLNTAAHELRNPMASIFGFSEVLLTQPLTDTDRNEFLHIIYQQSEIMISTLNELLDIACMDAQRNQGFVLEPIEAKSLVTDVVHQFKLPFGRMSPRIRVAAELPFILVDQKKAAQAILNVLSNAYKYSALDEQVDISIESKDDKVIISITNQGIGMTPAELKLVGTPFYRTDSVRDISGTGLGISIVREIMKLHQGNLKIESIPNHTTCVRLLFQASQ